jgi:hypothetical protein
MCLHVLRVHLHIHGNSSPLQLFHTRTQTSLFPYKCTYAYTILLLRINIYSARPRSVECQLRRRRDCFWTPPVAHIALHKTQTPTLRPGSYRAFSVARVLPRALLTHSFIDVTNASRTNVCCAVHARSRSL